MATGVCIKKLVHGVLLLYLQFTSPFSHWRWHLCQFYQLFWLFVADLKDFRWFFILWWFLVLFKGNIYVIFEVGCFRINIFSVCLFSFFFNAWLLIGTSKIYSGSYFIYLIKLLFFFIFEIFGMMRMHFVIRNGGRFNIIETVMGYNNNITIGVKIFIVYWCQTKVK